MISPDGSVARMSCSEDGSHLVVGYSKDDTLSLGGYLHLISDGGCEDMVCGYFVGSVDTLHAGIVYTTLRFPGFPVKPRVADNAVVIGCGACQKGRYCRCFVNGGKGIVHVLVYRSFTEEFFQSSLRQLRHTILQSLCRQLVHRDIHDHLRLLGKLCLCRDHDGQ